MKLFQRADQPNNLWRLLAYIKPYWLQFLAATICGLVKLLTPIAIIKVVGSSINALQAFSAGDITPEACYTAITRYVLIGLGISLVSIIPTYLRSTLGSRAVQEVIRNLRCDL